jgi:hypothetical protein
MTAFPTLLILRDREREDAAKKIEIELHLHGPVREFTLQMDLEKGCLWIWGIAKEGRFRLGVEAKEGAIELWAEKTPKDGIQGSFGTLSANERKSWPFSGPYIPPPAIERLSLGRNRSQDWAGVWQRMDLAEILPMLFHLSQWTPSIKGPVTGMSRLLDQGWEEFLPAAFSGMLSPRLIDEEFQGLLPMEKIPKRASAVQLIREAGEKIRSQFISAKENVLSFSIPNEFDCGRMNALQCPGIGSIDWEWAKRTIQKAIIYAGCDSIVRIDPPKPIGSFRIRASLNEKGDRKNAGEAISLQAGSKYYLDRFQK